MKKLILFLLSLLFATFAFGKTVVVGIDVSSSNPIVSSAEYAKVAASYVKGRISKLGIGDYVEFRTIGDRTMANFGVKRIQVTRSQRANKIADSISQHIMSLPGNTPAGGSSTGLVSFFEYTEFDCAGGTEIILLTDGIESSPNLSAADLLKGKPLPPPNSQILNGCSVVMVGFSQSTKGEIPPQMVKAMRSSWQSWMTAAGAKFTPIINP